MCTDRRLIHIQKDVSSEHLYRSSFHPTSCATTTTTTAAAAAAAPAPAPAEDNSSAAASSSVYFSLFQENTRAGSDQRLYQFF